MERMFWALSPSTSLVKICMCRISTNTNHLIITISLANVVQIMMALAIFFSYAIQFYVPVDIINSYLHQRISGDQHVKVEYLVRLVLVLFTFTLAAVIPKLDLFISLVGSVSSSTLALMAPSIIDTVTAGENCTR